jgi:hypothetical protein
MVRALTLAVLLLWVLPGEARQAPVPDDDDLGVQTLLERIETAVATSDRTLWMATLSSMADRPEAREFFDATLPQGLTRAVLRERDRQPLVGTLPGDGYRLVVEVFLETGARGRLATWMLDIRRPRGATMDDEPGGLRTPWRVVGFDRLSAIDGLHRLDLHSERQFAARGLVITSVDFELRLPAGDVFVVETAEGITGLVLLGDGTMIFSPTPATERGQVRIFAGSEAIDTRFDAAFVRLNPFEFDQRVSHDALEPVAVDGRAYARARAVFDDEAARSFSLDLQDLSRDTWSLLPQGGDFIAEVRTRRFRTLTYARSTGEPEDVSLFQRQTRKNISVYASPQKLASRGFYYNEDDLTEYDVLDHDIDVTFDPDREWLDGRSRLRLRVRAHALGVLTLRLHEHFQVSSITSRELGRLLFLRVRNQNSVVVNLPSPVARDFELTLTVLYRGRIERQAIDQESAGGQRGRQLQRPEDIPVILPEPNWLLSNRNYWYPQALVSDYATATLRVTVPGEYTVVATGTLVGGEPIPLSGGGAQQMYMFRATRPVRYLSMVVSRMTRVDQATVVLDVEPQAPRSGAAAAADALPPLGALNTVQLTIDANRRQETRGREMTMTAAEILRFYAALVGDMPYESFAIAMVEHDLPGGHSPAYMAVLNNPLPTTPFTWHNDPATFRSYPEFIIAHEIAHQWWGHAVGWKNYHEQWLSEGLAQYFAALYAQELRGERTFREILRQFRRWGTEDTSQGPIWLGYRLGHIKNDTRVFRALVYNKGAAVLHMLRRFLGDEAFFSGIRRFYAENRYRKAGTDDLQKAMEAASGRSLERFFERWVLDVALPRVRFTTSTAGDTLIVRYEQTGDPFDVPVTATLQYTDGRSEEVVVLVTEAAGEQRVPLTGALRTVDFNRDDAALGQFDRR